MGLEVTARFYRSDAAATATSVPFIFRRIAWFEQTLGPSKLMTGGRPPLTMRRYIAQEIFLSTMGK